MAKRPTQAAIRSGIAALEEMGKPVTGLRVLSDGSVLILATETQPDLSNGQGTGENTCDALFAAR